MIENNLDKCFRGDPAPCTCACPFGIDLRALNDKIKRGGFGSAYKTYRDAVVFPEIVSRLCPEPCKAACLRCGLDDPLEMGRLERALVSYAASKDPVSYNLPKKNKTVAIIGAGPAGLACTQRFASKKYDVTVFEAENEICSSLSDLLDPEIYLSEIKRQFGKEKYTLNLGVRVDSLADMAYDVIFNSTGAEIPGGGDNVFSCPETDSPVFAIAEGLKAAVEMEWFLKTSSWRETSAPKTTRLRLDLSGAEKKPAVHPADGGAYSKEESTEEAGRCLSCDCDACVRSCPLLQKYEMTPFKLKEEIDANLNPIPLFTHHLVTRLIASCNSCGSCREACPEKVDICGYIMGGRRAMQEKGTLPPAFHDYWMRDMEFSGSKEAGCLIAPAGGDTKFLFFPGCQLGGSDPRYVTRSYEYMLGQDPSSALFLNCCGAPALWAGDNDLFGREIDRVRDAWSRLGQPVFVLACPSCARYFEEYLPEIERTTLYEFMCERGIESGKLSDGTYSVFDPCASRAYPEMQSQVRSIAALCGAELSELPSSGSLAQCCGFGGHIYAAAPDYARSLTKERADMDGNPYITYCTNCRDVFSAEGKTAVHILDAVFDLSPALRLPPTATQRRDNRRALKNELEVRYMGADPIAESKNRLIIGTELARKISCDLILEENILDVIESCEASGKKLVKDGRYVAHEKRGIITYWVEYSPSGDGFEVHNAYSHRMQIEEDIL